MLLGSVLYPLHICQNYQHFLFIIYFLFSSRTLNVRTYLVTRHYMPNTIFCLNKCKRSCIILMRILLYKFHADTRIRMYVFLHILNYIINISTNIKYPHASLHSFLYKCDMTHAHGNESACGSNISIRAHKRECIMLILLNKKK